RARHTRHIALYFGIQLDPVFTIFLLLGCRPRLVRDVAPFNHADPGGLGEGSTERDHRACVRLVSQDVPVGGVHGLPDPVEVGLAIRCPAGIESRVLTGWWNDA